MKKIIPVILLALITLSCQKDPDMDKLDSNFVVMTSHDKDFDFSSHSTYYIPDSIMVIGKKENPDYWVEKNSEKIIGALVENMNERGYQQTDVKSDAGLGIQVSYVEDTSYFSNGGYNNSYWWWGYPGYWNPGYWGNWGGWYYPYPVVYQYNVGSILIEMVDLKAKTTDKKLPVRWTAYMSGLLYGSNFNTTLAVNGIDQAFVQSPYLKNK